MLNIYTVAFWGHSYIYNFNLIEELLKKHIKTLIDSKEYVDFFVGRNGDFDRFVTSAILSIQKNHSDDNSSIVLMLPYTTAEYLNNQAAFENYYSNIEISSYASNIHPKAAIKARNKEMVDRADLIICYIENKNSGAYKTIQYAKKQNKNIINLAEEIINI